MTKTDGGSLLVRRHMLLCDGIRHESGDGLGSTDMAGTHAFERQRWVMLDHTVNGAIAVACKRWREGDHHCFGFLKQRTEGEE